MTWSDIGKNNLRAAKLLRVDHPRSSASRAYYAAHVVLTEALSVAGCPFTPGRQTPAHNGQARLIGQYLSHNGAKFVKEARTVVRRLYARRVDADYKQTATVDRSVALASIRDAATLFSLLDVR